MVAQTQPSGSVGSPLVSGGSGSTYLTIGKHLYTAANTIDVVFTANTAGTRTTGAFDFYVWIAKVVP